MNFDVLETCWLARCQVLTCDLFAVCASRSIFQTWLRIQAHAHARGTARARGGNRWKTAHTRRCLCEATCGCRTGRKLEGAVGRWLAALAEAGRELARAGWASEAKANAKESKKQESKPRGKPHAVWRIWGCKCTCKCTYEFTWKCTCKCTCKWN